MVEYTETFVKQHPNPITFDRFLAIPYKEAMVKYGETFADQHRKLCDMLRMMLMQKYTVDQQGFTSQTPGTPSEVDNLAVNIENLSLMGRQGVNTTILTTVPGSGQMLSTSNCKQGVKTTSLTSSSGSGQMLSTPNSKERASVKDRLGVKIKNLPPSSG